VACGSRLQTPPVLFPAAEAWKSGGDAGFDGDIAWDGERAFVARRDGSVEAFDPATGRQAWRRQPGEGALSAAKGGLFLRQADGKVVRLDPASGRPAWTGDAGIAGRAPAVLDDDLVFVAGSGLVALRAVDGSVAWQARDGGDVSAPVVASGARLYVGEEDGTLRCRDRATGETLWTYKTASALRAPVLVDGERLYVGTTDGRFLCLSTEKGKQQWRWKLGADVVNHALLFDTDSVLFATYENVLYALDRGNGHLKWRAPLPSRPLDGPRLSGTAALVSCLESDIAAFDARTGRALGKASAPGEIRTASLVVRDRLLVGLRDRSLVALGLDLTPSKEVRLPPGPRPESSGPRGVAGVDRQRNKNGSAGNVKP
jgi:outer membrane protein assembly factor BamB